MLPARARPEGDEVHPEVLLTVAAVPAGLMLAAMGLERLEFHLLGNAEAPARRHASGRPIRHDADAEHPTRPLPRLPSRPLPR
jgi:hypothetical protein